MMMKIAGKCVKSMAFTERERMITRGQHVFDNSKGCPNAGDSDEISYNRAWDFAKGLVGPVFKYCF